MLVQRQSSKNLRNLLLVAAAAVLLGAGYLLYSNFSSSSSGTSSVTSTQSVPLDFGQSLFQDSRFYSLTAQSGTSLIQQTSYTVSRTDIPAPEAVQTFDVKTGGSILFSWTRPDDLPASTTSGAVWNVRLYRVSGDSQENLATLPVSATSYLFSEATDNTRTTYALAYTWVQLLHEAPQVQARTGQVSDAVTIATATTSGVTLQWSTPVSNATAIEIFRSSTVGELGTRIAHLDPSDTSYVDQFGKVSLSYYTVQWIGDNARGTSWQGTAVSTDTTAPSAPDSVRVIEASDVNVPTVEVRWDPSASTDVVSYQIYRSAKSLQLGALLGTRKVSDVDSEKDTCDASLCFADSNLTAGQTYYYTVVAVDSAGNHSTTQGITSSGRSNPFASP